MKNEYYIGYRDRLGNYKSTWIKAKNPQKAECKFYKQFRNNELIEKIALK